MDEVEGAIRRQTSAALRRSITRLTQRLRSERPPDALSNGKISVLSHLLAHGPNRAGQIAEAEHQLPQSLTRVFAELEADGLINRSRGERDGREFVLTITSTGRELLIRDMWQRDSWLSDALSVLSTAEVGLLGIAAALMDRLADFSSTDSVDVSRTG